MELAGNARGVFTKRRRQTNAVWGFVKALPLRTRVEMLLGSVGIAGRAVGAVSLCLSSSPS